MGRAHHQARPVRITTAASSRAEDISHRQRRYVISMAIRTLCFVGAVLVGPGWLRWVLFAGALFLPYVAVVFANASEQRDDSIELMPPRPRPELDPPETPDDAQNL